MEQSVYVSVVMAISAATEERVGSDLVMSYKRKVMAFRHGREKRPHRNSDCRQGARTETAVGTERAQVALHRQARRVLSAFAQAPAAVPASPPDSFVHLPVLRIALG